MSYYGYHQRQVTQREAVSATYGGLDDDVRRIFFNLAPSDLERVFQAYERVYGRSKRQYAERVYRQWRSGEVRMSGAVSERLLDFLPPLLDAQTKYNLIEMLWTKLQGRRTVTVEIRPDTGYDAAMELISATVREKMETSIPAGVRGRLRWLSGDDAYAAERLMKEVLARRATIMRQEAASQIRDIFHRFEREKDLKLFASKEIVLGGTTIVISMKRTPFYRRLLGYGTTQW